MGRLSAADLRGVLAFLSMAGVGSQLEPLPRPTLVALRDLLGADEAEYFELQRADRMTLALTSSDEVVSAPGTDEALLRYGQLQNPIAWRRWSPTDGALRLSETIRRREFGRLEFYGEFMAPNGLWDVLKVWLWSSSESVACVQLWRHQGDFGRREQDLLNVLQQDLIRLRAQGLAGVADWTAHPVQLTPREAGVLVWAVRGYADAEIAARLGAAQATIGKHLEHAYEKLGVRSRSQAIDQILFTSHHDGARRSHELE